MTEFKVDYNTTIRELVWFLDLFPIEDAYKAMKIIAHDFLYHSNAEYELNMDNLRYDFSVPVDIEVKRDERKKQGIYDENKNYEEV